jgi:RNA polymerase sigma-70 factor (ECF subfamily)
MGAVLTDADLASGMAALGQARFHIVGARLVLGGSAGCTYINAASPPFRASVARPMIESCPELHYSGRQVFFGKALMMAVPAKRTRPTDVDRVRLERLFSDHHAVVWRALRRRGLTPDAVEDATQETFLLAAERLDDIRPESERAFLLGTAFRVAHSLGRKTVRWELDDEMDQRLSDHRDAGQTRSDKQLCDLVMSQINPELIEVFVLYELEGFTSPEIAELLQIPLGSVASRLRRAREQFRGAAERLEESMKVEESTKKDGDA